MAVYAVGGFQNAVSTGLKTAIAIWCSSGTPRRFKIFDINVSQGGPPASTDTNIEFDLTRLSATGAGINTALIPVKNDPADSVSSATAAYNFTAEPTTYDSAAGILPMFQILLNQRAPYRWQTYLGSGAELVCAATVSAGAGLRVLSGGYTGSAGGTIYFQEQ